MPSLASAPDVGNDEAGGETGPAQLLYFILELFNLLPGGNRLAKPSKHTIATCNSMSERVKDKLILSDGRWSLVRQVMVTLNSVFPTSINVSIDEFTLHFIPVLSEVQVLLPVC